MHQLTIQLVTWNSAAALHESLPTLRLVDPTLAQIRVIDNASGDESVKLVQDQLPHADVIRLSENTGFAGGHNEGFARCLTPYVAVLNPDVKLDWPGLLKTIDAFTDERVGAVQGKLYRQGAVIDSVGILMTSALNGRERGAGETDRGQYERQASLSAVTGACSVYRLAALRDVADSDREIFDKDFWAYKEDVDLGWRLRKAGWKILYVPVTVGKHGRSLRREGMFGWSLGWSAVRGRLGDPRTQYSWRNWLWMIVKNVQAGELVRHSPAILGRLFVIGLLTLVFWPWWHTWVEVGRELPAMIAKRGKAG